MSTKRTTLTKLAWYWHRLRAMSPGEVALRLQKKAFEFRDAKYRNNCTLPLEPSGAFPALPQKKNAPPELLRGLARDVDQILRGEWKAFGHLPLKVDDPPKWQHDYLVGLSFQTARSAFKLDHRAQPGGADIKIIWEPNRWYQLVRLALAAWLLDHAKAQEKCVEWLADWARTNPPFTGLNWTSGLETGIRLVQFTWIDRFLSAAQIPNKTLAELRRQILPPHAHYTWRYKSFGSSANNHLIGELAGLILALARWPELEQITAPLKELAALMEREILAQFAPDGGNREQALGYHLFSWEFCWQALRALESAGITPSAPARERLVRAGQFYAALKPKDDPWDFGDSDNAWVTPLFAQEEHCTREWWNWFHDSTQSPALRFWWGDFESAKQIQSPRGEWTLFQDSGYATLQTDDWFLRFDFSPLGYLSMAPHGHLDALHLSVWYRGVPVIIDPGTGAYHAEKQVRNYFADWAAHNGPHLKMQDYPNRHGTFLWGSRHKIPTCSRPSPRSIRAVLELPFGKAQRTVAFLPEKNAIRVEDHFQRRDSSPPLTTRWKFAPHFSIREAAPNQFIAATSACSVRLAHSPAWKVKMCYNPPFELSGKVVSHSSALDQVPIDALVSPAFRALTASSYLALESVHHRSLDFIISPG